MADELQALLTRMTDEELKKASVECETLRTQAKEEAAAIIAQAKNEAAALKSAAETEAAASTKKGTEALKQAARDIMLSLRGEMEKRVQESVQALLRSELKGENLSSLLANLITAFLEKNGTTDDLQILLSPEELKQIEAAVSQKLAEQLRKRCSFAPSDAIRSGFQLEFKESSVVYDFSDAALAEAISTHVAPKLAALLK